MVFGILVNGFVDMFFGYIKVWVQLVQEILVEFIRVFEVILIVLNQFNMSDEIWVVCWFVFFCLFGVFGFVVFL